MVSLQSSHILLGTVSPGDFIIVTRPIFFQGLVEFCVTHFSVHTMQSSLKCSYHVHFPCITCFCWRVYIDGNLAGEGGISQAPGGDCLLTACEEQEGDSVKKCLCQLREAFAWL